METLKGNTLYLRALEPEDLIFLYDIENNESFWEVSHTQTPFSKFILKQYLENAHLDIYEAKQLRLVIVEASSNLQIGAIDLFDYNPLHKRAGVGIVIHPEYQQKGFAQESLAILINYAFTHLNLHQLYANITSKNTNSLNLFTKMNFKEMGRKKDWILCNGKFIDEISFQLIKQ